MKPHRWNETDALLFILGEQTEEAQAVLDGMLPGELQRLAGAAHTLADLALATGREKLRQEAIKNETPCDRGYPLGGMNPRTDWCSLLLHHKGYHVGAEDGRRFGTSGSVRRKPDAVVAA